MFSLDCSTPVAQVPFSAAGHFKEALFNRVSLEQTTPISQTPISGPEAELDDDGSGETRYPCGRKGCIKVYRQASGLRYHLKHVRCNWVR